MRIIIIMAATITTGRRRGHRRDRHRRDRHRECRDDPPIDRRPCNRRGIKPRSVSSSWEMVSSHHPTSCSLLVASFFVNGYHACRYHACLSFHLPFPSSPLLHQPSILPQQTTPPATLPNRRLFLPRPRRRHQIRTDQKLRKGNLLRRRRDIRPSPQRPPLRSARLFLLDRGQRLERLRRSRSGVESLDESLWERGKDERSQYGEKSPRLWHLERCDRRRRVRLSGEQRRRFQSLSVVGDQFLLFSKSGLVRGDQSGGGRVFGRRSREGEE
mmetsp:Transcript_20194/g.38252  ORF Transcript_20194/g.38252 Transcript_20194/m.38252 type:complete len:271 (-) Transcript_20194:558-1370(-)